MSSEAKRDFETVSSRSGPYVAGLGAIVGVGLLPPVFERLLAMAPLDAGSRIALWVAAAFLLILSIALAKRKAGTLLGSSLVDRYRNACAHWPTGSVPAQYRDVVRSGKPALIVSGERDPVTPAIWGDETAQGLTNSRHLVVPGAGHFPVSPCIELIQNTFLLLGDPGAVATECVQG
jgi:pimeloyl-ACP methyl ester carboxylesterase